MWIRNISNRYKKPGKTVARWQTVSKRTYSKYENMMCDRQSDVSNTASNERNLSSQSNCPAAMNENGQARK